MSKVRFPEFDVVPAALPEVIDTAAELVEAPAWLRDFRVSAPVPPD